MFRPIKNFITYIQKNASGGTIFGGATPVAEAVKTDVEAETAVDIVNEVALDALQNVDAELEAESKMEQIDLKPAKDVITISAVERSTTYAASPDDGNDTPAAATAAEDCEDEEEFDIEMQIKSSIMLKKPLETAIDDSSAIVKSLRNAEVFTPKARSALNEPLDDELSDFRNDPMHAAHEDYYSVGSAEPEPQATLETEDEITQPSEAGGDLNTEDEDVEESFLDLPDELAALTGTEIIVVNDTDLNSSLASETPSEDPLAIDDATQPPMRESTNLLDSSTNDEASAHGDVLWLNLDKSKTASSIKLQIGALNVKDQSAVANKTSNNNINNSNNNEQVEELRGDGSDSGLGSETSALQPTLNSVTDISQAASTAPTPTQTPTNEKPLAKQTTDSSDSNTKQVPSVEIKVKMPLRSNLKRRLEIDDDVLGAASHPNSCGNSNDSEVTLQKKLKRSINFDTVQVYYFPRQQGFGCVPSAGGCTLGMGAQHISTKTLTLTEHAAELRRAHRLQLQEINPRGSSSEESEESEEDYLSDGSGSDLDAETNGFLQPVSPKQRRALLKAAGIRKIDASEKADCRDIRNSREVCGCTCRDFCDPETCACSQAGIKCQVDRAMFPCGCSRDACGNTVGRVEFNPTRVRTHFIHTIMRLEMENRQQANPPCGYGLTPTAAAAVAAGTTTSSTGTASHLLANSYYGLGQPQSNYSSGYASPAYTSEPAASYYQPQATHYSALPATAVTPELLATPPQYHLDSLDANLFAGGNTNSTPSYGELLPTYAANTTATYSQHHGNINYGVTVNSGLHTQVSAYASYHPQHSAATSYLPTATVNSSSTPYSSCAVPSIPPFGTATTTAATTLYHSANSLALETTAPSCSVLETESSVNVGNMNGNNSFISLNTPIASSTRYTQINDLLQHNRNTTAALVAVTQTPLASAIAIASTTTKIINSISSSGSNSCLNDSIVTPPIEDAHKNCLGAFDALPTPLQPTPIVAVHAQSATTATMQQTEPPPSVADSTGIGVAVDVANNVAST